ncbi:MAG TPA: hypothetical protein VI278_02420 [Nitrososphaeraceae archaeon]
MTKITAGITETGNKSEQALQGQTDRRLNEFRKLILSFFIKLHGTNYVSEESEA